MERLHESEQEELRMRRLMERVADIFEERDEKNDKRYAFKPVEWIVYGMVAAILMAFLAAVISKVGL